MVGSVAFYNNYSLQLLALELVLCWDFPRRKGFWLRLLPAAAVYLALPYVLPGGYFAPFLRAGEWFTLGFFLALCLSGGVLALCFTLSWREVVFFCCLAQTVQHAIHCMQQAIGLAVELGDLPRNLLHLLLMLAALAACGWARRRGLIPGADLESGHLLAFAGFSCAAFVYLSLWTTMVEHNTVGLNLFDVFCCVELLMILLDTFQLRKARQDRLMTLHMLEQERAQHELAKANIEVINRKCHDLKHQVAALRRMNDQAQKEQALDELERSVLIYDRFAHTGSDDLDVVLTEKGLLCERKGIQLQCMADGGALSFMEPADIYSLFGNALDNAIEAVEGIDSPDRRIIALSVAPRGKCLAVHMENPAPVALTFEDGLPSTTKGDRDYHGFGLQSMRYIAEKYGGTLTVRQEDGVFLLDILFLLNRPQP